MKNCFLTILLVSLCLLEAADSTRVNPLRLTLAATATAGAAGAAYYVMQNAWWSDNTNTFSFDSGADLKYAKNIDKAAHFYGGYVVHDLYYRSLVWSGVGLKEANYWSLGLSSFVQVLIDVKDGYSPHWGFSVWDVVAGVAGAGYGSAQKAYPALEGYDIKFSYYYREGENRFNSGQWAIEKLLEDYPNQTYWFTANINRMLPHGYDNFLPDFLGLAIGLSVEDKLYPVSSSTAERQLYLSIDIDLKKLVSPLNSPALDTIAHYLNYFKVPMPALMISPKIKGYPLYF